MPVAYVVVARHKGWEDRRETDLPRRSRGSRSTEHSSRSCCPGSAMMERRPQRSSFRGRQMRFDAAVPSSSRRRRTHRPSARCRRERGKCSLAQSSTPIAGSTNCFRTRPRPSRSCRPRAQKRALNPHDPVAGVLGSGARQSRDQWQAARGFNTTRLVDLPMLWPEQWSALCLEPPIGDHGA